MNRMTPCMSLIISIVHVLDSTSKSWFPHVCNPYICSVHMQPLYLLMCATCAHIQRGSIWEFLLAIGCDGPMSRELCTCAGHPWGTWRARAVGGWATFCHETVHAGVFCKDWKVLWTPGFQNNSGCIRVFCKIWKWQLQGFETPPNYPTKKAVRLRIQELEAMKRGLAIERMDRMDHGSEVRPNGIVDLPKKWYTGNLLLTEFKIFWGDK